MLDRNDELENFKKLNLCDYAASRGFVADRRASSKHSMVLRHPRGDKLIIGRDPSGKYYYFNAKGGDSGTIIDLCQMLDGGNLGDVRKTLRAFDGSIDHHVPSSPLPFVLQPSEHDAARVLAAWMSMRPINSGHAYLTNIRSISAEVQTDPIFRDRIRIDAKGNAVFPHFNRSGLCGYELKNGNHNGTTFTGFAPGGVKALACSRPRDTDREAVICETSIDMLSIADREGTDHRRFFSTAGQISPMQAECLRSAISRMPEGSRVVLALDNDDGGRKIAARIKEELAHSGVPIVEHYPPVPGQDWNDVLQDRRNAAKPEMRLG
ncbi:DUF3991 and TOPRIM domain-containing protein [Rubripirellula reticaptiva]|nr:DUF3991 and TOPRIM domain-containing protein [Rubripirellula reticaptiva]